MAYNSLGGKLCRYDESPGFSRGDEEDISDRGQGRLEVTGGCRLEATGTRSEIMAG